MVKSHSERTQFKMLRQLLPKLWNPSGDLDRQGASVSPAGGAGHQRRPSPTGIPSFWSDSLLPKLGSGGNTLRLSRSLPFQPHWSESGLGAAGMSEFWKALKV